MDAHLIDSAVYGHGWSTAESVTIFSERARLERWVYVLKALAAAQADLGIIPEASARAIDGLDARSLDPDVLGAETRRTSHSTIGLVRELQSRLPEHAREHVYYGATVQDVSDTAAALEMRDVGGIVWRDLREVEGCLLELAARHRDTPMLGRTHGQPGAPITFGLKVASWADETARHLERWRQSRSRLVVGQLAGAVGALGFYGEQGPALRSRFCERLGLGEPTISWLTARDRIAEFASNAALVSATMARMANEVYNLQRREVGEVAEAASEATMGSITMPHKRNPERSEQMVTLARLVRSAAGVLTETMVGDHERDGRTWKTEWVLLPEMSHYLLAQLGLARGLAASIEVDARRDGGQPGDHGRLRVPGTAEAPVGPPGQAPGQRRTPAGVPDRPAERPPAGRGPGASRVADRARRAGPARDRRSRGDGRRSRRGRHRPPIRRDR